ncbi:MAG: hypothetical protein ACYC4R_06070 [Anaerolineae bacterium]
MPKLLRTFSLCLLLLAAFGVLPQSARAQDPNRAGVVVVLSPDRVITQCVSFSESQLTGAELLRRAGLRVVTSQSGGIGETICKVEDTGCDFPGQDCFCQCPGATCNYWSYWYWENGDWVYSGRGASNRQVVNGGLDAWVWGDGKTKPPDIHPCEAASDLTQQEPGYPAPAPTVATGDYPMPVITPYLPEGYVPPEQVPTNTPRSAGTPTPQGDAYPAPTAEQGPAPTQDSGAYPGPGQASPTARATLGSYPGPAVVSTQVASPAAMGPSGTQTADKAASLIAEYAAQTAEPSAKGSSRGGYVAFGAIAVLLLGGVGYALYVRRKSPSGQ